MKRPQDKDRVTSWKPVFVYTQHGQCGHYIYDENLQLTYCGIVYVREGTKYPESSICKTCENQMW